MALNDEQQEHQIVFCITLEAWALVWRCRRLLPAYCSDAQVVTINTLYKFVGLKLLISPGVDVPASLPQGQTVQCLEKIQKSPRAASQTLPTSL